MIIGLPQDLSETDYHGLFKFLQASLMIPAMGTTKLTCSRG